MSKQWLLEGNLLCVCVIQIPPVWKRTLKASDIKPGVRWSSTSILNTADFADWWDRSHRAGPLELAAEAGGLYCVHTSWDCSVLCVRLYHHQCAFCTILFSLHLVYVYKTCVCFSVSVSVRAVDDVCVDGSSGTETNNKPSNMSFVHVLRSRNANI